MLKTDKHLLTQGNQARDKDLITLYKFEEPPLFDHKTIRISRSVKIVTDHDSDHYGTYIIFEIMKNRRNEEIDWEKLWVLESVLDQFCNVKTSYSPSLVKYQDYSIIFHKYALRIQLSFQEDGNPFCDLSIFEKGIMFCNLRKHLLTIIFSIMTLKQKGVLQSKWLKMRNIYVDMDNFGIKIWNYIDIDIDKEFGPIKKSGNMKKNKSKEKDNTNEQMGDLHEDYDLEESTDPERHQFDYQRRFDLFKDKKGCPYMKYFYRLLIDIREEFKDLTHKQLVFPCKEVFNIDKNAFDIFIGEIEEQKPFENNFKIEDLASNEFFKAATLNDILEKDFGTEEFMNDNEALSGEI